MKNMLIVLSVTLAMALGVYAQHSHNDKGTSKDVTLVGEVIDPVCYLSHGSTGKDHMKCAEYCVKQGMSLGILEDKTGQVYVSLPADHSNPNAKLKDFIAEKVKVTGTVYSKGGLTGIHVKNIERVGKGRISPNLLRARVLPVSRAKAT
ncbi:MAG: hypothetical protein HY314_11195 [Acidobacteria bacterium]|nr:hypothetical protein [Acidobacteriota bacterium]